MSAVKISVSLPDEHWAFIEQEKRASGRKGTSQVVQDAMDLLMKSKARKGKYGANKLGVSR